MTAMTAVPATLDVEQTTDARTDAYQDLLARLSHQSVVKHFDAYGDVDWDAPEMAIDPDDPRWELPADDPLAETEWYRSQPAAVRTRVGLHRIAVNMKIGLQFESVLKRGLLEFASQLPNRSPEFRYAYHELIEEAQHSLMFQEFVNRTGLEVEGMPKLMQFGARRVVRLGRRFPELFFLFVLGGEDPIDFVQRQVLRSGRDMPPILERIMRIHVTEEARHLSFARHYLKRKVPELSWVKRQVLAIETPFILGTMAAQMLYLPRQVVRTYGIPRDVVRTAYVNPRSGQYVRDSLRKVRELVVELGLVTPVSKLVWKGFHIWDETARAHAAPA